MAKFRFVMVSANSDFAMPRIELMGKKYIKPSPEAEPELVVANQYIADNVDYRYAEDNKRSLAEVYNEELDAERKNPSHDFLVFMHADVWFDIGHFVEHCEEVASKYDVIGLCGCEKVHTSQSPLNWFTSSIPSPNHRWGCVTHIETGRQRSFFSADRQDVADHAVGCIDGLCIVFGKKALESVMKFDSAFSFDCYDTDISFQTTMEYGMKLGVIVEESLVHYSVGKSILSKDFLMHEVDLRTKWGLEIPQNSPIWSLPNEFLVSKGLKPA